MRPILRLAALVARLLLVVPIAATGQQLLLVGARCQRGLSETGESARQC